ncbi:glycoside hydrolase family 43 protein [Actinacidiphila oryziradicis]|uniref:glycoside hydrolase family 43 protein n=1 Tax=Actinacidiphila oryziradicis TaxID=2571141 RepID=UPI0023F0603F|nr:glycoside hydrolase family 43 protein [Actinacidiphila oryziradicis]MCW2873037.1 hydrolase [Actinacidiphila oryziradicis]
MPREASNLPLRSMGTVVLVLLLTALCCVGPKPSTAHAAGGSFRNPLGTSPDPYMTYYQGNYYLAATEGDAVRVAVAPTLGDLLTAPRVTVWQDSDASRNQQVWAPSFYLIGGHWYIYYTADNGVDDNHRLYVVESEGTNPLGPYHFKAELQPPNAPDEWAIDPVLLRQSDNSLYLLWSGAGTEGHNLIYISPMSSPWTVSGNRVYLPADGGCSGIREAPSILQHNGTTFLVYSTCDTGTPDYQLWMKSIPGYANPLQPGNWTQHTGAVFSRNDATGVWGPGSNGFFKSPDGTEDWIVYHGKNTSTYTYTGRTTRAQKITWNADGTPDFGAPLAAGATQNLPSGDPGGGSYWINDTGSSSGAGSIAYTGAWNSGNGCGVQCFWSDDHWSAQPDATAVWTFTGTRITLLSVRDTGNGTAAFSVDGRPETTSDYYGPIRMGEQLNYVSPELPYGQHTLRVRVTGNKDASSSAANVSIDRAEVYSN